MEKKTRVSEMTNTSKLKDKNLKKTIEMQSRDQKSKVLPLGKDKGKLFATQGSESFSRTLKLEED